MKTLSTTIKKALWSSDQHTLHQKTPTEHILNNLNRFYYKDNDLSEISLVVLGGDFYDRLVDAAHSDMRKTQHWIRKFLLTCKKYGVVVRVLEGTTSHEREQTENFVVQCPKGLDLKWVKELSYEHIESLGLDVFYVPDNLSHMTPDQIWDRTLEIMSENNIRKFHYVFAHFAMEYQIPLKFSKHSHSEKRWESIVKFNMFVGHVHKPSEYGLIRVSGSFDRIAHGEDHPKGAYKFWWDLSNNKSGTEFWENKNALPYVRVLQHPNDTTETLSDRINDMIKSRNLISNSRVQVRGKNAPLIKGVVEFMEGSFPNINFDIDSEPDMDEYLPSDAVNDLSYSGVTLDKKTTPHHLRQFFMDQQVDTTMIDGALELLGEYL